MKKKIFFLCLAILAVAIGTLLNPSISRIDFVSSVYFANSEALSQENTSGSCNHNCISGGCGAATCEYDYIAWNGTSESVKTSAQFGYYACCYATISDTYHPYKAHCYSNSCCN